MYKRGGYAPKGVIHQLFEKKQNLFKHEITYAYPRKRRKMAEALFVSPTNGLKSKIVKSTMKTALMNRRQV